MMRYTAYFLLPLCLALLVGCQPAAPVQEPPRRPNLILIMADDLGYETLACNGGTSYATPRLDALADGGTRFTRCYAQPLCTPSRVKIMTGKYNFRNYVGFGVLDPGEKTFGHLLRDAGYVTGVTGKWQLYGTQRQRERAGRTGATPAQAGFDESCLWQVMEKYGSRYKHPWIERDGGEAQQHLNEYGPEAYLAFAKDFIHRHRDTSFFLYYPMLLTHDPFQPTPDHPDYADFDGNEKLNDTTYFRDYVAYMDKIVGQLVDHLDAEGLREQTLVLFVGDNGTDRDVVSSMGSRRIRGDKGNPTEAGTRVPMIASWPGRTPAGQVRETLIDFSDFLPTLMEIAGAPVPEAFHTDGVSFADALMGQEQQGRDWLFCHYAPQWGDFTPTRFVHDGAWKLYETGEIYHTAVDPEEQQALQPEALDETARERIETFRQVFATMK